MYHIYNIHAGLYLSILSFHWLCLKAHTRHIQHVIITWDGQAAAGGKVIVQIFYQLHQVATCDTTVLNGGL